ncbi:type II secretion system minor pseudopilin GspK [Reinekea thalattae]|uniref:Type II secretion system protein K n=1 Tax=Reinekea thalattae TaxID=2593301 RepID=A0A5C8Z6G9_9GAMM|nr:type II secretion system minor pseudopilin GspK [Reinekea thalattae]TXR53502.1 hypothetical protein FME95_02740 [Reinekea thalattae]
MRTKQGGFVLIQVMLVFAILIIVAAKMQYEQRIQIERVSQQLFVSQAQSYIESAEDVAMVGLYVDSQYSTTDHLYELWNTTNSIFPPSPGWLLSSQLHDLQGRFNVNWLAQSSPDRDSSLKALQRLLLLLELEEDIAEELYNWFSSESDSSLSYAYEQPAYAASKREMADLSELLLLKAVSFDGYQTLTPYLSALPADSSLNINTAPALVIQSIAAFIDESSAEGLVESRGEEGFSSVDDFLSASIFRQNNDTSKYLNQLSVSSSWFELYSEASYGSRLLNCTTLLYRDNDSGQATVFGRNQSLNEPNPIADDPVYIGTYTELPIEEE